MSTIPTAFRQAMGEGELKRRVTASTQASPTPEKLISIGQRAIEEHTAWVTRNTAREAKRTFLRKYLHDTGEWFVQEDAESEQQTEFQALANTQKSAQKALAGARGRLRVAINKAVK